MNEFVLKLEEQMHRALKPRRFRHTLGVAYTAAALAMDRGADMEKAYIAGLLHDCAKCIPEEEMIVLCEKRNVPLTEFEKNNPALIHAKLGSVLAEQDYGIKDPEILQAIRWHTTGRPEMSLLEEILFTADYIEPNRDRAPDLSGIRALAFSDPPACVVRILEDTIAYIGAPEKIDTASVKTLQYYRDLMIRSE